MTGRGLGRRERAVWAAIVTVLTLCGMGSAAWAAAAVTVGSVTCDPATVADDGSFSLSCRVAAPAPTPTASASPSVTPPPTMPPPPTTPGPMLNCLAAPSRCGFPDASNTGPSGNLVTWVGSRSFTTAGQVVSDTVISGCVEVRAANVTFRNVQINANGCFWGVRQFSTNAQFVDSAITCGGFNGTAFGSSSITLTRVEITRCENGLDVDGGILVQDSWIHDMNGSQGGAHTDGAQLNRGATDVTFRHNTINMGPGPGATGAVMIWNEGDPQARRVSVDGNLLAWGTYTIYCGRMGVVDNIRITNNRFGPAEFGHANACDNGEVWSGNVRDSDGQPLAAA